MTKRIINRAIKHLGLEIQNNRDGYSYFTKDGITIGDPVMVCYLKHLTLQEWVSQAEWAIKTEAQ
jgi:hypothetical protein